MTMPDRRQTDRNIDERIKVIVQDLLTKHEERETTTLTTAVENTAQKSGIERHAQTILISVITAAILFSATFIYNSNASLTVLTTRVEYMTKAISKLEAKLDEMNNNYVQKEDFNDLEKRVRVLEQKR